MKFVHIHFATGLLVFALSLTTPARADEKLYEPIIKRTLEQQVIATLSPGDRRTCPQVRKRSSLMEMFPSYLIDKNGNGNVAEYKMAVLYGNVLRVTQLLPDDHPSGCKLMGFVADTETGKLDVGAYEYCGKDHSEELRYSDAFYFDPEKKRRMGREHKLRWDIAFRRLMWKVGDIAAQCSSVPITKKS